MSALNGKALDYGPHTGHQVHLHAHTGHAGDAKPICSKRWLCLSCADKDTAPKGAWFDGPLCPGTVPGPGRRGQ